MDSPFSASDRMSGKQESPVHDFFGRGLVADIILWRRKDVTVGILLGTLFAWVVFELSSYTLLSLVANVLLLLASILFLWSRAATVLNRPLPPIPNLQISDEMASELASSFRSNFNAFFSAAYDLALGKNPKLFFKVAGCLWLMSFIGNHTDFITFAYTGLVLILTLPVLYEKYEYHVHSCGLSTCAGSRKLYVRLDTMSSKYRKRMSEKIQKIKLT